nr:cellulase [uncultured bacterium]
MLYNKDKNMKKKSLFFAIIIALAFVFCMSMATCPLEKQGNNTPETEPEPELELTVLENEDISPGESAADFVAKVKIGWNLGNTLDAHPGGETSWGNPLTTRAMITAIKENGFNTIRIPVSWYHRAPKSGNYAINSDFMNRVKEVVDYAVENNLYIILNTHHDEEIFKFMDKDMDESKKAFEAVWRQIAETFKDYDYKLVFEGLNEPRTKGSDREWQGGTAEERKNLNEMHQIFVDTVRASGGNNGKRILMISTYAASVEPAAVNGLTLPVDTEENSGVNKFIVSVHSYSPYNFALNEGTGAVKAWSASISSDTRDITGWIDRVYTKFVSNGIPVIGGEFGALNRNNEDDRAAWAEFYVSEAGKRGIKCIWWDDGGNFRLFNRASRQFYFPKIHAALMRGAGVAK